MAYIVNYQFQSILGRNTPGSLFTILKRLCFNIVQKLENENYFLNIKMFIKSITIKLKFEKD